MQTDTAAHSLLDEADFMAALRNLETGVKSTAESKIEASLDTSFEWAAPAATPAAFVDGEVDEAPEEGPSVLWRLTAAAMFVLLMGVGAACAAAVFHDRVARIVATWQM